MVCGRCKCARQSVAQLSNDRFKNGLRINSNCSRTKQATRSHRDQHRLGLRANWTAKGIKRAVRGACRA